MTATMKLTKTEAALLRQAAANHHGCVGAGRSVGKRGMEGQRATRAIASLRDKGLLCDLRQTKSTEAHRGVVIHHTEVIATITEAGRKALEA